MEKITKRFAGYRKTTTWISTCAPEKSTLFSEKTRGEIHAHEYSHGLYRPDSGSLFIEGKELAFSSPGDARKAGIGMVHQHFMLIPSQTVWET
jgi:simple sugar transport system ATP-binding protein